MSSPSAPSAPSSWPATATSSCPEAPSTSSPSTAARATSDPPTPPSTPASSATLSFDEHAEQSLVTTTDPKPTGRSPLLLVDLDTADEQRIDTHVPAAAFRLDAGFGPNHLVYSVDDGPRSGIYVAHLPPSE